MGRLMSPTLIVIGASDVLQIQYSLQSDLCITVVVALDGLHKRIVLERHCRLI